MRLPIVALLSVLLCQCATVKRDVAPVVRPGTQEPVIFGLPRDKSKDLRPSQFMAAMENVQAEINADNKTNRGFASILGIANPEIQKAYLSLGGPQFVAEMKDGTKRAVLLPVIQVFTDQVPAPTVQAAMPKIQSYCYRLLSRHLAPIRVDELKAPPKKS